jgi:hypothetical protein
MGERRKEYIILNARAATWKIVKYFGVCHLDV